MLQSVCPNTFPAAKGIPSVLGAIAIPVACSLSISLPRSFKREPAMTRMPSRAEA